MITRSLLSLQILLTLSAYAAPPTAVRISPERCLSAFHLLVDPGTSPSAAWQAAHAAYNTPRPDLRTADGTALGIDRGHQFLIVDELKRRLEQDYQAATNEKGALVDPFAFGNKGHLEDHVKLNRDDSTPTAECPNGCLKDIFGINAADVETLIWAHDNDKKIPHPDDARSAYALEKLNPEGKNPDAMRDLVIGLHGQKSLMTLAQVIDDVGRKNNWGEDRKLIYFDRIADGVGGHNSGPDLTNTQVAALRKKYPSLSEADAKTISRPFYDVLVNQGNLFGSGSRPVNEAMGFSVSDRDMEKRSPLSRQLISLDRGTILNWKKVGLQNQMKTRFGPKLVEMTFGGVGREASALIKAVGDARAQDILPGPDGPRGYWVKEGKTVPESTPGAEFRPYSVADLPSHRSFIETSKKWVQAAQMLAEQNTPQARAKAGIPEDETSVLFVQRGKLYRIIGRDVVNEKGYVTRYQTTVQITSVDEQGNLTTPFTKTGMVSEEPAILILGRLLTSSQVIP